MQRRRAIVGLALLTAAVAGTAQAMAGTQTGAGSNGSQHRPRFDWHSPHQAAPTLTSTSKTLPLWSSSINDGGTTYDYTMVGTNPTQSTKRATTSITTAVVPLVLTFPDGTVEDPTKPVPGCDPDTPLNRTLSSPIFADASYVWGGTAVGQTQYVDAFQRANFWSDVSASNPNYHVTLSPKTLPAVTINVPVADYAPQFVDSCSSSGLLESFEINWFDNLVQTTLLPKLAAEGYGANTFPVFVIENAVQYDTVAANCCILGYHNAVNVVGGVQSYAVATYDDTGDFSGSADITPLSHEVGEWMDDPLTNNATPPWGGGQVAVGTCQSNLEVGDPLTGTDFNVTMPNGFTYHPQELAFFSWFFHQQPSIGVNGWYSNRGTFTQPAAACTGVG